GDALRGERHGAQARQGDRAIARGADAVASGVEAPEGRVDLLHRSVERLEEGQVGPSLAAGLPAVHPFAVAGGGPGGLLGERQPVALLRLLAQGGEDLPELVRPGGPLVLARHALPFTWRPEGTPSPGRHCGASNGRLLCASFLLPGIRRETRCDMAIWL